MASNPYIRQFVDELLSRYPTDGASMTHADWVEANTRLNSRPFRFTGYEFQRGIVDDMHPDLSVKKPSQVGMTEVQIRKFLAFLARNRGTNGIFTFPNERMFKSNSKTRFRPVVQQPCFGSTGLDDDKPNRSMNLYEVNGSFAHVMGMTEGEATSTPADILFHDEVDLSDQVMIALFQSRLQNSDWRITQKFSTPTFPGFGIDAAYLASDQRQYFLKCQCCGHQQIPDFKMENLCLPGYNGEGKLDEIDADMLARMDLDASYVKCAKCSNRLDMNDPSLREWVQTLPARDAHGYEILPFSTARLSPAYIIRQLQKMRQLDNIKGWNNTVLGRTFSDGNSKLEPDVVKKVMRGAGRPEISSDTPVVVASDMGRTCHLTMGVIKGSIVHPVLFELVSSDEIVERMAELRKEFNVVAGAVDRHPYTPTAEQIRIESKGIILPVEYRGTPFMNLKEDEYENLDYVQINRTAAIDFVVKAIQRGAFTMEGFGGLQQVVIEHLCDMVRIEAPEKPATWEKLTGKDHFMHSLVLLQASIKIRQLILMTNAVPAKKYLGVVGVEIPLITSTRQLGDAPKRTAHSERLI